MDKFEIISLLEEIANFKWLIIIFIIPIICFTSLIYNYRRINRQNLNRQGKATGSVERFFNEAKHTFTRFLILALTFVSLIFILIIIAILYYFKHINYNYLIWILSPLVVALIFMIFALNKEFIEHAVDSSKNAIKGFLRIIGTLIVLFFAIIGFLYILGIKQELLDKFREAMIDALSKVLNR